MQVNRPAWNPRRESRQGFAPCWAAGRFLKFENRHPGRTHPGATQTLLLLDPPRRRACFQAPAPYFQYLSRNPASIFTVRLGTVAQMLSSGMTVSFAAHGNSMVPRIRHGQRVRVAPVLIEEVKRGDVVLAKVEGRWFLHKVSAISSKGVQISNNHGHVNGWTRTVVGILTD